MPATAPTRWRRRCSTIRSSLRSATRSSRRAQRAEGARLTLATRPRPLRLRHVPLLTAAFAPPLALDACCCCRRAGHRPVATEGAACGRQELRQVRAVRAEEHLRRPRRSPDGAPPAAREPHRPLSPIASRRRWSEGRRMPSPSLTAAHAPPPAPTPPTPPLAFSGVRSPIAV